MKKRTIIEYTVLQRAKEHHEFAHDFPKVFGNSKAIV
jgi:hypothetical protein